MEAECKLVDFMPFHMVWSKVLSLHYSEIPILAPEKPTFGLVEIFQQPIRSFCVYKGFKATITPG